MAKEDTSAMMAALTGIQSSQGMRKAAILMVALGEEISSKVMAFLDDEEVSDLSKEIALTRVVPPEQIDEVVEEFYNMMLAKKFISKGGLEYAKSILVKSLGPERARKIIDRLTKMLEQSSGFEFLTKIDPKQLAKFIMNEHPQTIALILAHLDPSHAAESMAQLPEDLKAEAEDNSDSVELIEALGNIFDKQVKKISSLEAKLDRVIVETTINNKNKELDLSPFEDTLNRFLVAMDDKMSAQQDRINTLEAKLEEVLSIVDSKETAQLTKKVGGMDRQIAKLNKSIEKIASHVVEK